MFGPVAAVWRSSGATGMIADVNRHRLLIALAFGVIVMASAGALAALEPAEAGIQLSSLPQGGSAHEVDGRQVILVRDGDAVRGFLRMSPRGHGMVSWCRDEDVLLVPSYGETFDREGRLMRDFSPRDLDSVQVAVQRGLVVVSPDQVTKGRSRIVGHHIERDRQAIGEWRAAHPDRDLPVDFCGTGALLTQLR
jgi:hypothetical protein